MQAVKQAKENLATHTAEGYQGCLKSDKAVIDTKKELAKVALVTTQSLRLRKSKRRRRHDET